MGGQTVSQQAQPGLRPTCWVGGVGQEWPDGRSRMGMLFLLAYKRSVEP